MDTTLTAAVQLFNEGRYLAAHELFEELWEANEGGDADFYKGWIQASICLHHLHEGNPEGAAKLYAGHRRYLGSYMPTHAGLEVERFLTGMQRFFLPVLRGEPRPDVPDARARPRIEFSAPQR